MPEAATATAVARPKSRRTAVVLALLTVYIIWGSTYLAIRIAIQGIPPLIMAGTRHIAAGGLLYLWLRMRGEPNPTLEQWKGALNMGFLLLLLGNGGVVLAEKWVSSSLTALLIATVPLWMALFQGLLGKWPRRLEWFGLGLGVVGAGLLQFEGDFRASPLGAVLLIGGAAGWAFGSVRAPRLKLAEGLMSPASTMLLGGVLQTAAGLAVGERFPRGPIGWQPLVAVAYLGVFGSIVAFSAYAYLLKTTRPAIVGTYAFVNPVVAVIMGVGFAGERISSWGVAGMLVILAGVGLITFRKFFPERA